MIRPLRRLLPLAAAAVAVALPLSGCGAEDLDPSAIAQAADRTAAVDGMHMKMSMEIAGQSMHGDGFVDPVKQQGHMTMDVPGAGTIEEVVDGLTIYMKLPESMGAEVPDGKEWFRLDMGKALKGSGIDMSAFMNGGADPAGQMQQLKAMGDISKVGTEDIDGVQTTHYKGEIDLHKVADVVPADQRDAARKSAEKLIELTKGDGKIPTEIWIGPDNRIRRFSEDVPSQAGVLHMTVDYTDFGATEAIDIPSKDDTYDITDETSGALSSAVGG
jgi:hypothetical protein